MHPAAVALCLFLALVIAGDGFLLGLGSANGHLLSFAQTLSLACLYRQAAGRSWRPGPAHALGAFAFKFAGSLLVAWLTGRTPGIVSGWRVHVPIFAAAWLLDAALPEVVGSAAAAPLFGVVRGLFKTRGIVSAWGATAALGWVPEEGLPASLLGALYALAVLQVEFDAAPMVLAVLTKDAAEGSRVRVAVQALRGNIFLAALGYELARAARLDARLAALFVLWMQWPSFGSWFGGDSGGAGSGSGGSAAAVKPQRPKPKPRGNKPNAKKRAAKRRKKRKQQ